MLEDLSHSSHVVGLKQSLKMLSAGKVKKVYLASDADFHVSSVISDACEENGTPLEVTLTKSELGRKCRIQVDAAVVAIL